MNSFTESTALVQNFVAADFITYTRSMAVNNDENVWPEQGTE